MHLTEIKQEIRKLPLADKQELAAYITLQLKTDPRHKSKTEPERDVDLLATEICNALQKEITSGLRAIPSHHSLRPLLNATFKEVQEFMKSAGIWSVVVGERIKFYRLLAPLMVAYAKKASTKNNLPLTPRFVLSLTNVIPGLVDQAFPGYAASGMLKIILERQLQST